MFRNFAYPIIWQWWNRDFSDAPELIRYCHKTVCAHNSNVQLTIGSRYPMPNLRPDHQADYMRAEILARFRGLWLDVDYLCWGPIMPHINQKKFNVWRRDDGIIDNDFLYAPSTFHDPQNLVAKVFHFGVTQRLDECGWSSHHLPTRGYIGADLLNEMKEESLVGPDIHEAPTDILCPYRRMVLNFDSFTDDEFTADPKTTGMMLLNSLLEPHIKNAPVKELAASQTVLGAVLRYADSRLPEHLRGFEVEKRRWGI